MRFVFVFMSMLDLLGFRVLCLLTAALGSAFCEYLFVLVCFASVFDLV